MTYTFSQEAGTAILYLDGVEVARQEGLKGSQFVNLGHDLHLGNPFGTTLQGQLDDLAFYRTAVTKEQVKAGYSPSLDRGEIDADFTVETVDAATRIFDASGATVDGKALPEGTVYTWTFGDGTTAQGRIVQHCYAGPGDHNVTLTVTLPKTGRNATAEASIDIASPAIVEMGEDGRFLAYEGTGTIDLGRPAAMTDDGLQLGGTGTVHAQIARAHVVDIVGSDSLALAFTLDADKAGAAGDLFRVHGSFMASVTVKGELNVGLWQPGNTPPLSLTTVGARLNPVADMDRDIVIGLEDGQLQIWVDSILRGQKAVPFALGGVTGVNSHGLLFGTVTPTKAVFEGDISNFHLGTFGDDLPDAPATQVIEPGLLI